jgi:hypothetical protein
MSLIHDEFLQDYFYQLIVVMSRKIINQYNNLINHFLTVNNYVALNIGKSISVSFSSKRLRNNDNKHIKNCSSVHCSSNE